MLQCLVLYCFFAPAVELPSGADDPSPEVAASAVAPSTDVMWPMVLAEGGEPSLRRVPAREQFMVNFDISLAQSDRRQANVQRKADGSCRWPAVFVLLPGAGNESTENPQDGALMVFCVVANGILQAHKRILAWGGNRTAFHIKDLYGIQEAQQQSTPEADALDVENKKNCVVCLTSPKDTALMPCGHFCVCNECGTSIRLSPMRNRCPLCRADVADIMLVNVTVRDVTTIAESPTTMMPASEVAAVPETSEAVIASETAATPAMSSTAPADELSSPARKEEDLQPSPADMRAKRLEALERRGLTTSASTNAGGNAAASAVAAVQQSETVEAATVCTDTQQAIETTAATANSSASAEPAPSGECTLPPKCLQRLTREMRQIEQQRSKNFSEYGIELDLSDAEGNDLRVWSLRVHANTVDNDCTLGKELRRVGASAMVFEVWIPDEFPVAAPKVRVLSPCFSSGSFFVHGNGALCLEILSRQGWSPAMSLVQLGQQLKVMMSQGSGSISSSNVMAGSSGYERDRAWATAVKIEAAHKDWDTFQT